MTNELNRLARFKGASIEHLLVEGTKRTYCNKDATLANRYPSLTLANSTDRRAFPRCKKCLDNAR